MSLEIKPKSFDIEKFSIELENQLKKWFESENQLELLYDREEFSGDEKKRYEKAREQQEEQVVKIVVVALNSTTDKSQILDIIHNQICNINNEKEEISEAYILNKIILSLIKTR